MKLLSSSALALLALVGSAQAQYFSAGWTPGQQAHNDVPTATFADAPSQPTVTAVAPKAKAKPFSFSNLLDINNILTSEPVAALFNKFGINITDRVQTVLQQKLWDDRVTLITDDNFNDLIVNEPLTPEEEKERVWLLVISVTAAKQEGISKYLDNVFDNAFNETQIAGDLPYVKWGRIDYLNVTYITTKWGIWQAPYLVIATERAQKLRFYRPQHLRLNEAAIREFLAVKGWEDSPVWSTSFAPGGSREWIMDFQAKWFTLSYNWLVLVPKWILVLASGSLASILIRVLHKPPPATPAAVQKPTANPVAPASSTSATPSKSTKLTKSKPASKAATPVPATDSEREASAPPAKRTSTRQRKPAKH